MLANIAQQDLVLTANRRLANDLRQRYDQYQLSQGHDAWRTPTFLPLSTWLHGQASVNKPVISDTAAHLIWQDIIQESERGRLLICTELAAKQAFDAWVLCEQWQLTDSDFAVFDVDGLEAFRSWKQCYQQRLSNLQYEDKHTLLRAGINVQLENPQATVHLVGFERFVPIISKLINDLKQKYSVVEWVDQGAQAPIMASRHTDQDAEFNAMVNWAAANSHQRVACIVPEINTHHARIAELFAEQGVRANIAAAVPLSRYALIETAQLLLRSVFAEANHVMLSSLDRSPFVQKQPEQRQLPEQSPRKWAQQFSQVLTLSGWPGKRLLTSEEFQAKARFAEVLQEFAQYEAIFPTLSQYHALAHFGYCLDQVAFQPKDAPCSVQVLGVLEASGLEFDAIWLQGMTDEALPQALNPNPFLPISLQRQLNMPRSNPEQERLYAESLVERLRRSCSEFHVSYPEFDGDRPLAISPLFTDVIQIESSDTLIQSPITPAAHSLEHIADSQGPKTSDNEPIRGGSYILKAQATCPFKAFAEIRLHAEPVEEPTAGIDPSERGIWVHEVLQSIWTELQTHADLLAADVPSLIDRHIQVSARKLPKETIYQIEALRLKRLITQWLEYEAQRPPFSLSALETEQTLSVGDLTMTMRLDRLDKLADGSLAIIDYKTGKASMQDWFSDRPVEPQLPLYCLANDQVTHLTFANVRLADAGFSGVSDQPSLLPDTKPVTKFAEDWAGLRRQWQNALTRISDAFCAGDARVDPKNGAMTCQYCVCQPICRIFENGNR